MVVALGLLSAFGPLSMDLYLPALPALVADLRIPDPLGQATMSANMVGLAAGQLLLGPLSDRFGRRRPMLIGLAAFAVLSLACAFAPTIETLLIARAAQGIAGSAGIVIARAVVRDMFTGEESARAFAMLAAVVAIMPIIAPLLGGGLLLVTDWRGLFVALAGIGVLLLALAWITVPDTLAPEHRHAGGVSEQLSEMGRMVRNHRFALSALALGLAGLGLFSYISMGPIVLQEQYGLSPQAFSLVMTVNAVGILIGTQISRRIVGRFGVARLAVGSVAVGAVGATAFTVVALLGLPLPVLLVPLFGTILVHGAMLANVTALALAPFSRGAGAASALLGMTQFGMGALVPPLVSLGGTSAPLMGVCMAAGMLLSLVLLSFLTRRA
ncbi:multidrug effflux MFS transporter [Microbacterium album]|uniref:Bcr/CflA family drug resistance efflux transporter n=1 Tax=Microbacterium album TaxID=2053191 RepID=A0A917IGT2_9MICO|nr:multidrug effflux MFS transporter [Microbacterium album]GGH45307.1 Bcr/CflA family drug resistance efflux transporter [Microbacterium album]